MGVYALDCIVPSTNAFLIFFNLVFHLFSGCGVNGISTNIESLS